MDMSICGANHDVLHAQNDRWGLGLIETIYSGHNGAVLNAQNQRCRLLPIDKRHSGSMLNLTKDRQ